MNLGLRADPVWLVCKLRDKASRSLNGSKRSTATHLHRHSGPATVAGYLHCALTNLALDYRECQALFFGNFLVCENPEVQCCRRVGASQPKRRRAWELRGTPWSVPAMDVAPSLPQTLGPYRRPEFGADVANEVTRLRRATRWRSAPAIVASTCRTRGDAGLHRQRVPAARHELGLRRLRFFLASPGSSQCRA